MKEQEPAVSDNTSAVAPVTGAGTEEVAQPQANYRAVWRGTAALAVAETTSWGILYYSFSVLLVPLGTAVAASQATVAGAFSLALFVAGLTARPIGHGIERWGVQRIMTWGAVLAVVSYGLLSTVSTTTGLYLVWLLIGCSHAAVLYEPAFAAITQWFPDPRQRSTALLLVTSIAGFASTIFVPLTATLCIRLGWRTTVLILTGVLFAVSLPLHATLPRPTVPLSPTLADARCSPELSARRVLLALLATVFTLYTIASTGAAVHLVAYLSGAGLSLQEAAAVAGLVGAAQVPGRLLFRPLETLLAPRWRFAVLLGVQAVALLGTLHPASRPLLLAAVVVWGATNGMITLVRATIIAEWFGVERYASLSGRVASWALTGRAAAPLAVSLIHHAHSYGVAFVTLCALLVLACGLIIYAEQLRRSMSQS